MTEIDRTNLRSAALQAVFMNDHDGVATALSQLDHMELKGFYEDAIKLASWVEGRLEQVEPTARETSIWNQPFSAPLNTYGTERDPDQMFQTGPMAGSCGTHGLYECTACYPPRP